MPARFTHDPNATLDYTINWDDGYLQSGENISTGSTVNAWDVSPATTPPLTLTAKKFNKKTCVVDVSGGIHGVDYTLRNRIRTDGTPIRIDDRTIVIKVWEPR